MARACRSPPSSSHGAEAALPDAQVAAAAREADASPNGSTTDALAAMLVALDRGSILRPQSRAWVLDTLKGTRTGPRRLKAGLPEGTPLAHKTGTGETRAFARE